MPSTTESNPRAADVCWICGSPRAVAWKPRNLDRPLVPDDLRITDHRYGTTLALLRCHGCDFIFAEGEEVRELTALYEALSDPGYQESSEPRLLQMRSLLDGAMRQHPSARSMLDVGAAAGLLVAQGASRGLAAVGVEPSQWLVEAGRAAHGVELLCGTLPHPELAERRFDLVFLVDIIEHVADPLALMRDAARYLAPDGLLVLVTPDVGSMAARVLRQRWWHFRLAHVGYFNKRSLARATEKADLVTVKRSRAKWYFSVDYLGVRLEEYLPVAGLRRFAKQTRAGRWLFGRVTPLNLYDSFLVFLRRADAGEGEWHETKPGRP